MSATSTPTGACGSRGARARDPAAVRADHAGAGRTGGRTCARRAASRGGRCRAVGSQQLVVVVEHPASTTVLRRPRSPTGVRAASTTRRRGARVASLPVDIRHNAKIDRAAVASWARHCCAGTGSGRRAEAVDAGAGHGCLEPDRRRCRRALCSIGATRSCACNAHESVGLVVSRVSSSSSVTFAIPSRCRTRRPGATRSSTSPRRSAWSATGRSTARSTSTGPSNVVAAARGTDRSRRARLVAVGRPRRRADHRWGRRRAGVRPATGLVRRVEGDRRDVRARSGDDRLGVVADPTPSGVGPGRHPAGRTDRRARRGGASRLVGGGGRSSTRPTSTTPSSALVAALDAVEPGAGARAGLRGVQRRAADDPRAGRGDLRGGRGAVRSA